ncbi:hypothetical protein BH09BAC6_BH09BAC6_06080 [soil metagenome]
MDHEIKLPDGSSRCIKITSAYFKSWHVWNVEFDRGKAVMLFKLGGEWMQRNEDFLDAHILSAIGSYIDKIIFRRKIFLAGM